MSVPGLGSQAPDFTLPSTSGSDVTLSSFRGKKVMLAFFPLAFTGVCTDEMCAFSSDHDRFRATDTVVLPLSVDSIPTLVEFKRKEGISLDLLSDFKREVSRLYGILLEDAFLSRRAYFVIDREGILRWSYVEDDLARRRPNEELLAQLAAID